MHPQSHCLIHIRLANCNQFYKISPIPWGRHFKREYSICGYALVYLTFHTGKYLICFYLLLRKRPLCLSLFLLALNCRSMVSTRKRGFQRLLGRSALLYHRDSTNNYEGVGVWCPLLPHRGSVLTFPMFIIWKGKIIFHYCVFPTYTDFTKTFKHCFVRNHHLYLFQQPILVLCIFEGVSRVFFMLTNALSYFKTITFSMFFVANIVSSWFYCLFLLSRMLFYGDSPKFLYSQTYHFFLCDFSNSA